MAAGGSRSAEKHLLALGKRVSSDAAHCRRAALRLLCGSCSTPCSQPTTVPTPWLQSASTSCSPSVSSRSPWAGITRSSTSEALPASSTAPMLRAGISSVIRLRSSATVENVEANDPQPSEAADCASSRRATAAVSASAPALTMVTTLGGPAEPEAARCAASCCARACTLSCLAWLRRAARPALPAPAASAVVDARSIPL
mmetsp:Transcript_33273/g.66212  ORF Transcript_33273/g.66212 Transcript_33273/m.66212 type:complete len:200 (+) Transcript_33273:810-1409(+)